MHEDDLSFEDDMGLTDATDSNADDLFVPMHFVARRARRPKPTGLRSNRALNRGNRGAPDHDIMEGLPVRQWRKQNIVVSTKAPKEEAPANDDPTNRWRELPMPRGSEDYSPMSQALLRAARRGRISQHLNKQGGDDKDLEEEEKKAPEPDVGIATTKWAQIAKDQEKPELEFLAKRRKGLPSMHNDPVTAQPMKMVKVKKIDAKGNAAIFEVLAPDGAVVEGEIVKDEEMPTEAPAPGTIVEGVGVANEEGIVIAAMEPLAVPTPSRRAPPRPKRKAKGPGRGRKKKKETHTPSATAGNEAGLTADGVTNGVQANGDTLRVPDASGDGASGTDVEMGENSPAREGEDGSDDDDDDEGDASDMDAPTRSVSPMKASEVLVQQSADDNPTLKSTIGVNDSSLNIIMTEASAPIANTEPTVPAVASDAMEVEPTNADIASALEALPGLPAPAASTESASETIPAAAPIQMQDPPITSIEDVTASVPRLEPLTTETVNPPPPEPVEPAAVPISAIIETQIQQETVFEQPPSVSKASVGAALASDTLPTHPDQIMGEITAVAPPQSADIPEAPSAMPPVVAEPPVEVGTAVPLPPPMPIEPPVEDASAPEPPPIPEAPLETASAVRPSPPQEGPAAQDTEGSETVPPAAEPDPANE